MAVVVMLMVVVAMIMISIMIITDGARREDWQVLGAPLVTLGATFPTARFSSWELAAVLSCRAGCRREQ